jgi:hypothetical protein
MPSEKSLYSKIQLTLETARAVKIETTADLIGNLLSRPAFHTLQYDGKKDRFFLRPSENTGRRVVRMCQLLELISAEGRLTPAGRDATRKTHFDRVISRQVRLALSRGGVDLDRLNATILKALRTDPPLLPTGRHLWNESRSELRLGLFSTLITLLAFCGGATYSQRKVFTQFLQP